MLRIREEYLLEYQVEEGSRTTKKLHLIMAGSLHDAVWGARKERGYILSQRVNAVDFKLYRQTSRGREFVLEIPMKMS